MSKVKVLIVDDDKNMRMTLSALLEDEGYEVRAVGSGEEAVEICDNHSFHVILMDVKMPGISGVEAFRQIRKKDADTRVILMSAYTIEDLKKTALAEGAIAFLPKPLNVEAVFMLIRDVKDTAVLVVEQDDDTSKILESSLKTAGFRVTLANTPNQAMQLVGQLRFELIFIAVDLPKMNGLDLYLAIKQITPASVAIMLSELGNKDAVAREAVRNTAYTIVEKPLNIDHVLQLIEDIRKQLRAQLITKPQLESESDDGNRN